MRPLRISILLLNLSIGVIVVIWDGGGGSSVTAQLSTRYGKECGEIKCSAHEFCSPVHHTCEPCQKICDPSLNNHDQNRCESDCQDYLHDLLYIRKANDSMGNVGFLESELKTLKILLCAVLALTAVVLALMVYIIFRVSRRRRGDDDLHDGTEKFDLPEVICNNKYEKSSSVGSVIGGSTIGNGTISTVLSSPDNPSNNHNSSTPNSHPSGGGGVMSRGDRNFRREPSESTLPEYSYDNPGLAPSPTHHL